MKRAVLLVGLIVGLLGIVVAPVAAQEATPNAGASPLAGLGYPELTIQVADDGFRMPGQVAAGRTLITLDNVGRESRHSQLLRLPDDLTIGDLVAGGGGDAVPPWFLRSTFVGFPGETPPGGQNRAVVDLTPGLYLVVDDFFQPFVVLPVEGEGGTPAAAVDPPADGTVRLFEYGFQFPDALAAGRHVWQVVNAGRESHELVLARAPDGTTVDQVRDLLATESEEGATPVAGGLSPGDLVPAGGMGWLSPGAIAWTEANLEPGTYVALCFAFGPDGVPHVVKGMVDVFAVG
jgi:hypothetical protein